MLSSAFLQQYNALTFCTVLRYCCKICYVFKVYCSINCYVSVSLFLLLNPLFLFAVSSSSPRGHGAPSRCLDNKIMPGMQKTRNAPSGIPARFFHENSNTISLSFVVFPFLRVVSRSSNRKREPLIVVTLTE